LQALLGAAAGFLFVFVCAPVVGSMFSATAPGRLVDLPTEPAEPNSPVADNAPVETQPQPSTPVEAEPRNADDAAHEVTSSPDPEVWRADREHVLRVQKKRLTLSGTAENGRPREVEMLTYNGRLVGPTIRVRRGETLKIKVVNELPKADEPVVADTENQADPPHDLYTTNLHTHGLHVSPVGNSDNAFREIPPGGSFDYSFTIPMDHPSGTFWYHPHKHGSVAYQLGNGLAGALIVEGDDTPGAVRDLESVPEVAAAQERTLVLQQLVLETDAQGVGRVDPRNSYNAPSADAYQVTTVNGMVLPTYTMRPDEVQRWRFVGAGREGAVLLCWHNDRDRPINTMPWHEIAFDGLATGTITAQRYVTMIPGKRSDVLVQAPSQRGTYYLTAMQEDETPGAEEILIVRYLAKLVVQGESRPMRLPTPEQLASCRPFKSIDAAECRTKRSLVFSFDDNKKVFHLNGRSFGEQGELDKPVLGTAEEWTLTALDAPPGTPNEPHPFHIHVNPFEVVQIENLRNGDITHVSEWRDTIAVEPGKRLTIRMRFADFPGKTVLHCHTLDHEDQGMMRAFEIVDPASAGPAEDDPQENLVECSVPAPPLALPTVEGSPWELKSGEPRNVVLVFFRGMGCVHCVRELRNLLTEARSLVGTRTTIVAVSSAPIMDPLAGVKLKQLAPGLELSVLVDHDLTEFRRFDCYRGRPLHGLFVIDDTGTIRARYTGETPFADAREVCTRVRRLLTDEAQ
jgi:FtsP/CotA-like multicopper oxidase with cupredoxin domain/peroxiredoxin